MSNQTVAPVATEQVGPEIEITIAGRKSVGKSTLALFTAMVLDKLGIEVKIDDDANDLDIADTLTPRMLGLAAKNTLITIRMGELDRDKVKLIMPGAETDYLNSSVANSEHLERSINQLRSGQATARELVR